MASSEKNRYFDLRKMSFSKKKFLGTISRQSQTYDFFKTSHSAFSRSRFYTLDVLSLQHGRFFFRPRKEKNTVQSMSNVGEDRIQINADAIQALNTFVGTTKSLTTNATTVVEGVNEVRQEALGATSATVVNSNAISTEAARAAQENDLSAAIGQGDRSRDIKGGGVGN